MKNLDPRDTGQLRRLARLYAKTGGGKRASALYQWCATAQQRDRFSFYSGASELLREVIDNLEGENRDEAVAAVLAFGDPGKDSPWGRDQYERLVLDTWNRLLGPEAALERSRGLIEKVTDLGIMPKRRAAQMAAYLLARAGDHDRALECP